MLINGNGSPGPSCFGTMSKPKLGKGEALNGPSICPLVHSENRVLFKIEGYAKDVRYVQIVGWCDLYYSHV